MTLRRRAISWIARFAWCGYFAAARISGQSLGLVWFLAGLTSRRHELMSDTFDPYRHWLGIANPQRPPDHYVLLGLDRYEKDREKIWDLAMGQMGRVLEVDPRLQSLEARHVFEELEAARDCLCHPQKKQDYDAQLRERHSTSPLLESVRVVSQPIRPILQPVSPAAAPASPPVESIGPVLESPPEREASHTFDPYREWLGITDPHRPLNHYVLLGLKLYEDDRERIDEVSMLLMAQALEHDPGPHCEAARRIFDELEAARDCLCDSQQKQAYDARLREPRTGKPANPGPVSNSASARKKSWGSLAPRGSSVLHAEGEGRSGSSAVAEASDSLIGRRAETPKPPEAAPEAPIPRDARQSRLAGMILGAIVVSAVVAYFLLREPPEHNPVPALMAQLSHRDPQQRIEAAHALRKLGPRCSDALPRLVQVLGSDPNEHVRLAVAQAVREAGPGTVLYSRDFEVIKIQESNPGVLQILNELTAK